MTEVIVAKNCRVCEVEPVCFGSVCIGCPVCGRKAYPPTDDGTYEDAIIVWNEMNRGEDMIECDSVCPKCGKTLDSYDLVGKRYPDGYRRRAERYDYENRCWIRDGYTVSNRLFYRCRCGANVYRDTFERVKVEP